MNSAYLVIIGFIFGLAIYSFMKMMLKRKM